MNNSVFQGVFAIDSSTTVFDFENGVSVFAGASVSPTGCGIFGGLFGVGGSSIFDDLFGECVVTPNSTGPSMAYGDYSFSPVPMLSISKAYNKNGNQINVGSEQVYTLRGNLVNLTGGIAAIVSAMENLENAFNADGKYFFLSFDGEYLLEGYPRIVGEIEFSETNDNWTQCAEYTLQLEFDNEPTDVNISNSGEDTAYFPPFLQDSTNNWEVSFDGNSQSYIRSTSAGPDVNPVLMRVVHTVGAVGKSHYSQLSFSDSPDIPAWKQAQIYVNQNVGFDYSKVFPNMSVASASGLFAAYDHSRICSINEAEGSYNVVESWAVLETGHTGIARKAIEDFNVEIRNGIADDFNSVAIQGSIQGLEENTYDGGFAVNNSKFANASGYWGSIKNGLFIYPRIESLISGQAITLNPIPISKTVEKSPSQGTINYSYEYNDRPVHCITGAKYEDINISDEYPSDVYSSLTVIGRPQGPVMQDMNTVTSFKRQVNIDVIMSGRPGCSYSFSYSPRNQIVNEIICPLYSGLTNSYSNVVKSVDSETWNPKTGRYNRSIGWVATDCDTVPNTSLC